MSKIKVALFVDEYFGAVDTVYGGYGFLARHLVAKYLPDEDIEVEVILRNNKKKTMQPECHIIDNRKVYVLANKFFWLNNYLFFLKKKYDVFLTIEMTTNSYRILRMLPGLRSKILFWIQDPRPTYEWEEIETVKLFPEKSYWKPKVYRFVHQLWRKGYVRFVTQATCLEQKARDLYTLTAQTPIDYLPNPIEFEKSFNPQTYRKKNQIVFLGRIESVKRGWLFCEIAKQLPDYEFFMLGESFREQSKNSAIMRKYQDISNLHFVGHVEGEEKNSYLRDAKLLVNTSIHEALPVSFLEALSYGTLLVSCRNPDNLTSRFGEFTGTVLGDGFDKVPLFVEAIQRLMTDEPRRLALASQAVDYIRTQHNLDRFRTTLKSKLMELVQASPLPPSDLSR